MWLLKKARRVQKNEPKVYTLQDYDETYFIIKKVLMFLGLRLMRKDTRLVKLTWEAFYWFEFSTIFVPVILDFVTIRVIMSQGNFEEATKIFRILPCIGYLTLALLKTYKIVSQRSVFENMIGELRSMWPQGVVSEEEHAIMSKGLKEIHFFVKAFYYCNQILITSIVIPPYVEMVKRAMGEEIPRILPYDYWTPSFCTNPGWFEFMVTLQSWQTMTTVWCVLLGDLMMCVFLSHITMQFDLLCVRIRRFLYVPVDDQLITSYPLGDNDRKMSRAHKSLLNSLTPTEVNNEHQKELSEILIRHKALIRLARDIESLFSFSLLINFFNSSIIICFTGFCSVLVEKWNMFMYKLFLVSALSQIWLLCWYGQKLFESSQRVSDALYNSAWYTASSGVKKSILIMIHRSQKSVHITTYGFSIICLESYTTIIKTAWSYLTLLLNTYNRA